MTGYHAIDGASLNRPDDYSGFWEAFWPNGKLKYRGHFVDGVEVGQQVCYWEDGTIAQVSWCDSRGCPRGTTVSFYPDGNKETEETWDETERHPGTFVRRCYDENGDVYLRTTYRQLQQADSWERPENEAVLQNESEPPEADGSEDDSYNLGDTGDLTLSECIEVDLCGLRALIDTLSCPASEIPEYVEPCRQLEALLAAIERGEITQAQAEKEYEQIKWGMDRHGDSDAPG